MQQLAARGERIDYDCWDLYAHVSQWYDAEETEKQARKQIRLDTLHALEAGGNETAAIADLVSTAILATASGNHAAARHRVRIPAPRERDSASAFLESRLRADERTGVLYLETEGKNTGCWVMRRAGTTEVR